MGIIGMIYVVLGGYDDIPRLVGIHTLWSRCYSVKGNRCAILFIVKLN